LSSVEDATGGASSSANVLGGGRHTKVVSFHNSNASSTASAVAGATVTAKSGGERKKSVFVAGSDGILTLRDDEATGESDDDAEDRTNPPLTLKDFQDFLSDFYGDGGSNRTGTGLRPQCKSVPHRLAGWSQPG
jgi:hypothetical protein